MGQIKKKTSKEKNEKGAAMITVLMLSAILLVASAGLILEASMNASNVTDAVAEEQAFYAAESGIQSALDVLRGNVAPSPLIDASKPATDSANLIDFKKAVVLSTSNLSTDTSPVARLSRWLPYNADFPDRVVIGDTVGSGTYSKINGTAYAIELIEPDNIEVVSFTTSGRVRSTSTTSHTFGSGGNTVTISYSGRTHNAVDVTGTPNLQLGDFNVSVSGSGATLDEDIPFFIYIDMSLPYTYRATIRGYITAGTVTNNSMGTVKAVFPTNQFLFSGGTITIPSADVALTPVDSGGVTNIAGTVSTPEPQRLLIRSVGYGPRGAVKNLEAIVQKNFFNGMPAPATLTLVGPSGGFSFDPGNSTNTVYSGDDLVTNIVIPPIGTTNDNNLDEVNEEVQKRTPNPFNGKIIGIPANVNYEMPDWLNNTTNLGAVLNNLKRVAIASNGYYPDGTNPPSFGNNAEGTGITFVDGDTEFTGSGGGILIVTGKLTLHGNFNFKGLIIVTGEEGVDRRGGGNGTISGNMVVAPYDKDNPMAGFTAPNYNLSGGGNSTMIYNSSAINNGLRAISNFALGVVEK